jgi:transposase
VNAHSGPSALTQVWLSGCKLMYAGEMKTLLAGAHILKLEKIVQMADAITLFVSSAQTIVNCPSCREATRKVHSRYERAVADLPWESIAVRLQLRVRKFFCRNSECPR